MRVRVTYDRLYVELQLKRSVKVPLWSQEKEKSIGKDRNSVELNHYIDALRVKFYQIYQDLELEGKIISARAIVNRYQGKDETFKTLYNVDQNIFAAQTFQFGNDLWNQCLVSGSQ